MKRMSESARARLKARERDRERRMKSEKVSMRVLGEGVWEGNDLKH